MEHQNIQKIGKNPTISILNRCILLKKEHVHALTQLKSPQNQVGNGTDVFHIQNKNYGIWLLQGTTNKYLVWKQLRKKERNRGREERREEEGNVQVHMGRPLISSEPFWTFSQKVFICSTLSNARDSYKFKRGKAASFFVRQNWNQFSYNPMFVHHSQKVCEECLLITSCMA